MKRMVYLLVAVAFISWAPFALFLYSSLDLLERMVVWFLVCLSIFEIVPRIWFGTLFIAFTLPSAQVSLGSAGDSRRSAIVELTLVGLLGIVDFAINVAMFNWSSSIIPLQILSAIWVSTKILLTQVSISLHSKRLGIQNDR
jgi:hypothetical protein